MTKQFLNYSDLITYTRASKGHALRPVSYGTELVTNGDFATDTSGWSAYSGTIAYSGGAIELTNGTSSVCRATQPITTVVGKVYTVACDTLTGGNATTALLGVSNNADLASAIEVTTGAFGESLSLTFIATNTTTYVGVTNFNTTTGLVGYFDNISVKEVLFDQPDGTLTLFEHPENIPRVEWDSAGNRLGLLVEEARTNLATYSVVTDANWNKSDSTINDNQLQAPNRITEAAKIVEDTDNNTHYVSLTCSGNTSTTYTGSFFLKSAEREEARVRIGQAGNYVDVWVDLTDGSLGNTSTGGTGSYSASSSTDYGNGWYRVSVTGSGIGSGSEIALRVDLGSGSETALYTGDGSSGIYVWGAQLEAGSFPTSYIKSNSGSTTTRSADIASIPVADFGYNQSAGTVVITAKILNDDLSDNQIPVFLGLDPTATVSNSYLFFINGKYRVRDSAGTTQAFIDAGSFSNSQLTKAVFTYKENDFAASIDGGAVVTDTSGTVVESVETLSISPRPSGTRQGQYVQSIQYYPRRLTNAQLQDLTS